MTLVSNYKQDSAILENHPIFEKWPKEKVHTLIEQIYAASTSMQEVFHCKRTYRESTPLPERSYNIFKIEEGIVCHILFNRTAEGDICLRKGSKHHRTIKYGLEFILGQAHLATVRILGTNHLTKHNRHEIEILVKAQTIPGVIELVNGYYFTGKAGITKQMIVMEYCSKPTLGRYLAIEKADLLTRLEVLLKIGCTIKQLHAAGITHRDIKEDNIFVKEGIGGTIEYVLADFEYAKTAEFSSTGVFCGTEPYLAPELAHVFLHNKDAQARRSFIDPFKADAWAFGMVIVGVLNIQIDRTLAGIAAWQDKLHKFDTETPMGQIQHWLFNKVLIGNIERRPDVESIVAGLNDLTESLTKK